MRASVLLGLAALGLLTRCDCSGEPIHNVVPSIAVSPAALDFGDVPLHAVRYLTLTVSNTGLADLHLSKLTAGAPFEASDPGSGVVAAGATDVLEIGFRPVDASAASGVLLISSDDPKQPSLSIPLSGHGIPGQLMLSPSVIDLFARVQSSTSAEISVQNTGGAVVTAQLMPFGFGRPEHFSLSGVTSFATGGALNIPAGGAARSTLGYRPIAVGPDDGRIMLLSCGPACGPEVKVHATATNSNLRADPALIDFGTVPIGNSKEATLLLHNDGDEPVSVLNARLMMAPEVTVDPQPSLPLAIAGHGFAALLLSFAPTVARTLSGTLVLGTSDPGQPSLPIGVSGKSEGSLLSAQPAVIDFGVVQPRQAQHRVFVVVNDGAGEAELATATLAGDPSFSLVTPPLPASLLAGESAQFGVDFNAPIAGSFTASITVTPGQSSDPPLVIPVRATTAERTCFLEVMPSRLNFGIRPPGSSATMPATLHNNGANPCTVTAGAFHLPVDPAITATPTPSWPLIIAAGAMQDLSFKFAPTVEGESRALYGLAIDDPVTPRLSIEIIGSAHPIVMPTGPAACVEPRAMVLNQNAPDQRFNIRSCGVGTLTVSGIDFATMVPEFSLSSPPVPPLSLLQGSSVDVQVHYTPGIPMASATINVTSNDANLPVQPVQLTSGDTAPTAAGQFLYFWNADSGAGRIRRIALQGSSMISDVWGGSRGGGCVGCHSLSPDGRYLALVDQLSGFSIKIIDTTTEVEVTLPFSSDTSQKVAWRPDVNTTPPYQFAYDDSSHIIHLASISAPIGVLRGADIPFARQPSWGTNGKIVFVRDTCRGAAPCYAGVVGIGPLSDLAMVDEGGGVAQPVNGASGNGLLNYYPEFSPNGRWIAYTVGNPPNPASTYPSYGNRSARIQLVAADQSGTLLTLSNVNGPQGTASSYPTWSHDGTFLSFSSNRIGGGVDWDLFMAAIDPMTGTAQTPTPIAAANSLSFEHIAVWSP